MAELISARDNPGTLREYEIVIILRPDTLQEGIMDVNNRIRTQVGQSGGQLLVVENWGKRRLAYEIRKQLKGIYMYYQFLGHGALVKELERQFRIAENVIRHFTLRVDENVDPQARPGELSEEAFLAASATRPDEEELATGYVMTGSGEKIPVSELGFQGFDRDDDDDDDDDDDRGHRRRHDDDDDDDVPRKRGKRRDDEEA